MFRRPFGNTSLVVSALGFGAGHIGSPEMTEDHAGTLINRAIDRGVNFVDTARGYGLSEERIGRHLSWRRHEIVICTKGGYGLSGIGDWTGECIERGVEQALWRMRTDWIDVFLLHSCPLNVLQRDDISLALENIVRMGKVRVVGYSGEEDALSWAIDSGRFGAVETSVNLCDQRVIDDQIPHAESRGIGVIAKRPLANAPWRFKNRPVGDYAEIYWERFQTMNLEPGELPWDEIALRYSVHSPGVATAIVGTASIENLERDIVLAQRGPLPDELVARIRCTFREHDRGWTGQV